MLRRALPLVFLAAACGRRADPARTGDAAVSAPATTLIPALAHGRLGDDAEVAQLEERYLERLRKNATLDCPHPLAGDASSGDPVAELRRALGLDGGDVAGCLADLIKLGDDVAGGLATCSPDPEGPGPGKRLCTAPSFAPMTDPVAALVTRCAAPVREALAAAAGHGDACSPFLPGRGPDTDLVGLVRVGNLAMLDARERARTGDPSGALDELIAILALAQDLSRHGDMVPAITAIAVTPRVVATASRILADVDLPPGAADRFAGQLDRLIAAAPDWSDATASEDLAELLAIAWPYREPYADPPGGPRAAPATSADLSGATPRELYGAELSAIDRAAKERANACDGKPIGDCIHGVAALDPGGAPMGDAERRALLGVAIQAPKAPEEVRATLVGQLAGALHAHVSDYVLLHALRLAQLGALRLQVELVRRHGRGCPDDLKDLPQPLERFGITFAVERRAEQVVARGPDFLGNTRPVVAVIATCSQP